MASSRLQRRRSRRSRMSRFRAGAARRSARLCCDEVDGARVAGDRSSTRYRDLLLGQWPVIAIPEPDELLSSWLLGWPLATACRKGTFGPALDLGSGACSGRLDLALPAIVRDRLVRCTGLASGAVDGMTLAGVGARLLLLPLRADLSPGRRGRRQAAWLQSVRTVWPKTSNPISGGNGAWRRRSPARVTGAACSTAARTADRDWPRSTRRRCGPRTIAPPAASISPARRRRVSAQAPDARLQSWLPSAAA